MALGMPYGNTGLLPDSLAESNGKLIHNVNIEAAEFIRGKDIIGTG
jgi:hypothetical protein